MFSHFVADVRDFRAGNNFTNELFSNEPRGDQICGCSARIFSRIFSRVFLFFSYYAIKQTHIPTYKHTYRDDTFQK